MRRSDCRSRLTGVQCLEEQWKEVEKYYAGKPGEKEGQGVGERGEALGKETSYLVCLRRLSCEGEYAGKGVLPRGGEYAAWTRLGEPAGPDRRARADTKTGRRGSEETDGNVVHVGRGQGW